MFCPICNTETTSTIKSQEETYSVKGEHITINAQIRFCDCCGSDIWDDCLDEQNLLNAFAEYRKKHKLLSPGEIRAIREQYGVSQTAFARILGFGDKTITRYENGSIADAAQNNLIELSKKPNNFKSLLEKNREKISSSDYLAANAAIEKLHSQVICKSVLLKYALAKNTTPVEYDADCCQGRYVYA